MAVAMDSAEADRIFHVMRAALVGRGSGTHFTRAFRIKDVLLDELTESGPEIAVLYELSASGRVGTFEFSAFPNEYGTPPSELPSLALVELEEEINERYSRELGHGDS